MSYMGCIGYIMAGSGLQDLLAVIYAEKSVEHMLSGHAYGRAVRGHILVHLALATLLFEHTDFSDDDRLVVDGILNKGDRTELMTVQELHLDQTVIHKLKEQVNNVEQFGPTAKL